MHKFILHYNSIIPTVVPMNVYWCILALEVINTYFRYLLVFLSRATDLEPTVQTSSTTSSSRAITGLISQPQTLAEVTQLTSVQKAKSCADRHHMSRNAIQRQNRVHHGVQHHSFHLQQPGHRNLSHWSSGCTTSTYHTHLTYSNKHTTGSQSWQEDHFSICFYTFPVLCSYKLYMWSWCNPLQHLTTVIS